MSIRKRLNSWLAGSSDGSPAESEREANQVSFFQNLHWVHDVLVARPKKVDAQFLPVDSQSVLEAKRRFTRLAAEVSADPALERMLREESSTAALFIVEVLQAEPELVSKLARYAPDLTADLLIASDSPLWGLPKPPSPLSGGADGLQEKVHARSTWNGLAWATRVLLDLNDDDPGYREPSPEVTGRAVEVFIASAAALQSNPTLWSLALDRDAGHARSLDAALRRHPEMADRFEAAAPGLADELSRVAVDRISERATVEVPAIPRLPPQTGEADYIAHMVESRLALNQVAEVLAPSSRAAQGLAKRLDPSVVRAMDGAFLDFIDLIPQNPVLADQLRTPGKELAGMIADVIGRRPHLAEAIENSHPHLLDTVAATISQEAAVPRPPAAMPFLRGCGPSL